MSKLCPQCGKPFALLDRILQPAMCKECHENQGMPVSPCVAPPKPEVSPQPPTNRFRRKQRIAAIVIFVQAVILPILSGSLGGSDWAFVAVIQVMLTILSIAVFFEWNSARWVALILLVIQIPVIESGRITWRVTAGSSLSIGVIAGPSLPPDRITINLTNGYVFNGAILRDPVKRIFTDGRQTADALMLNFAVFPAVILLGIRRRPRA